jgi:membrane associated rhomboid family serine protease
MATPTTDLLEIILRECAGARPQPWYPSDYARDTGVPRDALDESLDRLRLAGLIRLTDWVQGKGQGYTLAPGGERVLEKPRLLDRLRAGVVPRAEEPPPPLVQPEERPAGWERARAVRDALLTRSRPVVTLSLIAANVLVFLVGAAMAQQRGVLSAYLSTPLTQQGNDPADLKANEVRHVLGQLGRDRWQTGRDDLLGSNEWWRLVSCCFVHIGVIHLLMNMYALYVLGVLLERMWGPGRYLLLYLISGLVGSCAAVVFSQAFALAGASGAICGILGAMAAWVYLNRPYLPRDLSGSWMRGIVTNIILVVFISMVPGVSAAAHFGGGVGGLAAAVPMTYSRFGSGPAQRVLGLLGALLVPVVAFVWLDHSFGAQGEAARARARWGPALAQAEEVGLGVYTKDIQPLCVKVQKQQAVTPKDVKAALAEAERAREEIQKIAGDMGEAGSYHDARINAALEVGRDYLTAWVRLLDQFRETFAAGKSPGPEEARAVIRLIRPVENYAAQLKDSVLITGR